MQFVITSTCVFKYWNSLKQRSHLWFPICFTVRGTIKQFLAPVLWEWPRAEIVPLFLNIISLWLDALSPTLFKFAYSFKIETFHSPPTPPPPPPQVLINSIYDAFIASKIPTTKVSFQFWKKVEFRKG